MNKSDIPALLDRLGFPFAYDHFAEGEGPDPPFLVYRYPKADNFAADLSMKDSSFVAIMPTAVGNEQLSTLNVINQPVLVIDPAAELSLEVAGKGLRFSDPFHAAVSLNVLDQLVDAFQCFLVLALPIKVILPSVIRPDFVHWSSTSISSWAVPFPARSSATDFFT